MSDIELLPCPFCDGEAEFHRTPIKANGGWCDSVVVRCKECEARTNRVLYNKEKHGVDGEYDEAAAAWNTRKPMNKVAEQLIAKIQGSIDDYGNGYNTAITEAIEIIDGFDEIFGTFSEDGNDVENALIMAKEALEKQISKKPIHFSDSGVRYTDSYQCPTCKRWFVGTGIADYCYHCGQKLVWDREEKS